MIVNGVTLPDIPADVLAQYPYAVILHIVIDMGEEAEQIGLKDSNYYALIYSAEKIGFMLEGIAESITGEEFNSDIIFQIDETKPYLFDESVNNEWYQNESDIPTSFNQIGVVGDSSMMITSEVFWSNHDVYEITSIDTSTGELITGEIYFPNSEASHPERVSIGRSLVDGYAREVQRLTGTTDQMNAVQIQQKLSEVKAGIKIGDVVLPPIPEDVLAEFPYAMIGLNSDYNMYLLGVSDTPFAYLPAELTTTGNAFITTVGFRHKFYAYDGSAWVFQNENSTERIYQELNETIGVCWANDDICTITSRTDAQGEITVGTEVYFSERQNFNGVWLPKVPADVLTEYPYAFIVQYVYSYKGTIQNRYSLNVSTSIFGYLAAGIISAVDTISTFGSGMGGYQIKAESEWEMMEPGEFLQINWKDTIVEDDEGNVTSETMSILWSNHDIYEVTSVDINTMEYTTAGLYFPPLPAIDSDRISIGYDLCDGIVKEIQRLSGSTDKMNALRAYWKLTTVDVL